MNLGTAIRFGLAGSQLFNNVLARFIPGYKENAKTDGLAGMVGGSLGGAAAVYGWATGMDPALTTAFAGGAGYVGIQIGGLIQHWRDQRKAEAKKDVDGSDFVRKLSEDAAARLVKKPIDGPITDDSLASYWWDEKGTRRPAGNRPDNSTLGGLKAWDAVRVELADGRIWEKADQ